VPPAAGGLPAQAEELLERLGRQLGKNATVQAVFGEARTYGDRTIIPVARVAYGFGGGPNGVGAPSAADVSPDEQAKPAKGSRMRGVGRGVGLRVEPLAMVEIGPKGVRIIPIVDVSRMIGRVFFSVFGFTLAALVVSAITGKRRSERSIVGRLPQLLSRAGRPRLSARLSALRRAAENQTAGPASGP